MMTAPGEQDNAGLVPPHHTLSAPNADRGPWKPWREKLTEGFRGAVSPQPVLSWHRPPINKKVDYDHAVPSPDLLVKVSQSGGPRSRVSDRSPQATSGCPVGRVITQGGTEPRGPRF